MLQNGKESTASPAILQTAKGRKSHSRGVHKITCMVGHLQRMWINRILRPVTGEQGYARQGMGCPPVESKSITISWPYFS